MEYFVPSKRIIVTTKMNNVGFVKEILLHLVQLEEDRVVTGDHQNVDKDR